VIGVTPHIGAKVRTVSSVGRFGQHRTERENAMGSKGFDAKVSAANDAVQTADTWEEGRAVCKSLPIDILRAVADLNHVDVEPDAPRRVVIHAILCDRWSTEDDASEPAPYGWDRIEAGAEGTGNGSESAVGASDEATDGVDPLRTHAASLFAKPRAYVLKMVARDGKRYSVTHDFARDGLDMTANQFTSNAMHAALEAGLDIVDYKFVTVDR
jgi:hypothetical protein